MQILIISIKLCFLTNNLKLASTRKYDIILDLYISLFYFARNLENEVLANEYHDTFFIIARYTLASFILKATLYKKSTHTVIQS